MAGGAGFALMHGTEGDQATTAGVAAGFGFGLLIIGAMMAWCGRPGQPIDVVGHSFGGCAAGLGASGHVIRRLVTVGAQFAYWRDYEPVHRWRMFGKWHVVMPLVTMLATNTLCNPQRSLSKPPNKAPITPGKP